MSETILFQPGNHLLDDAEALRGRIEDDGFLRSSVCLGIESQEFG